MASPIDRLQALQDAARRRELTPLAWWIGTDHHDEVVKSLHQAEGTDFSMEGHKLASIDDLDVKVLTETPERFALWCEEGALDV